MKNVIVALFVVLTSAPVFGAGLPYDETADAKADLAHALAAGRETGKKVVAVFGANWCPDCRRLDKEIYDNNGELGDRKYIIVKVDVGNFDKNIDLARQYGDPIKKGIPGAVVITPDNKIVYKGPLTHLLDPRSRLIKMASLIAAAFIAAFAAIGGLRYLVRRAALRYAGK